MTKEEKKEVVFENVEQFLSYLQKNLNAPKNQYNKFGEYNYRNIEDIMEAIKPLLPTDGYVTFSEEILPIQNRIYVSSTATVGYKKEYIISTSYARETMEKKKMDSSQLTGGATSYARKYAIGGLLLIDDNKDADSQKPESKDDIAAKALGGSMASNLDPADLKESYNQAIKMLGQCDTLERLKTEYEKYYLKRKSFGKYWEDIEAKKEECKADIIKDSGGYNE